MQVRLLAESILHPEPQGSPKNVVFRFPASAVQGSTLEFGINTVWKFISTPCLQRQRGSLAFIHYAGVNFLVL